MNKRTIVGIISCTVLAGTSAASAVSIFPDIETHWAKPSIIHMYQAGVINGMDDGNFQPQGPITREQIVKMILLAVKATLTSNATSSFTDVPMDHWSHTYIETALNLSIIDKGTDGKFEPGKAATRAEVAEWIARAVPPMNGGIAGGQLAPFSDIKTLPEAQQLAISQVYHLGVMLGDNGLFRPYDPLTRAEAAVLIERLVDRIQNSQGGRPVAFSKVNEQEASADLKAWINSVRMTAGTYNKTLNGKTYVLHSMGEKPTLGYTVTVVNVVDTSSQITVNIEEKSPKPGEIVGQMITNPYVVIEMPATSKQIVPQVVKK